MDILHIILTIITSLLSGGMFPFLIKLHKDKKRLKVEQEKKQDIKIQILGERINSLDRKIIVLGEVILIYVENNGTSSKIKKIAKKKIENLKKI